MTPTPKQERAAIEEIRVAMRRYASEWGRSRIEEFPRNRIDSGDITRIPRSQVIDSVVLMTTFFGLTAGSGGDLDLYRLLLAYFHDEQAFAEMNASALESHNRRIGKP